jgi:hypothetical protein
MESLDAEFREGETLKPTRKYEGPTNAQLRESYLEKRADIIWSLRGFGLTKDEAEKKLDEFVRVVQMSGALINVQ